MTDVIANPDPAKVITRASECMRRLMEAGLTFDDLQRPIDDPEMRKRLVRFWGCGGFEATTSQKRAREIVGTNFFGMEEAITHFKVNPTKAQLAALAEIPYTEEVLSECMKTHLLVAVFPLSILAVREQAPKNPKTFYQYDDAWYNGEKFAKKSGDVCWRLIRKTPVANSTNKTWDEQQALLGKNEETPTAQTLVYAIVGHFLATGERLFENVYVRTSDIDSDGDHVYVGYFGADGLDVDHYWDGNRVGGLGCSSARKSE